MDKAIAVLALWVVLFGCILGNYWFTFGLWPKSWLSFFGFAVAHIVIVALRQIVIRKEN